MAHDTTLPAPVRASASYRTLIDDVGPGFLLLGFAGRLPGGMWPLGFLLYAAHALDSFALAGLVVGALSIGGGLGGPAMGVLADRFGQRIVGLAATVAGAVLLVGWMLVVNAGTPLPVVLVLAALVGASNPQVGSMARTRWEATARTRADRARYTGAAMALEGAIDETSFVVGPVLVSVLAGTVHPAAGLLAALVIGVIGQSGFALHRSALGPSGPRGGIAAGRPIPVLALAPLVTAVVAVGVVFGSTQTGIAAHFTATGQDALAGGVYAFLGIGSALAGLLTTRIPDRIALPSRMIISAAALVVLAASLVVGSGPGTLAIACFLTGVAVGPVLITVYSQAGLVVPTGRTATVMTSLATATVVGVAMGAALAGQMVELGGARVALAVPSAAGVLALVAALWCRLTSARP